MTRKTTIISLMTLVVLLGGPGGCGGGGGGGGGGGAANAPANAALSSVGRNLQTAIANIGGPPALKTQEDDSEGDGCTESGEFEFDEGGNVTGGTITGSCPCEVGGTEDYTLSVVEPNVFRYVTEYNACQTSSCGEDVTLDGGFEAEAVYDTSLTVTATTSGACSGITSTVGGTATQIGMNLQVFYNDIGLPEDEIVVTISGTVCTDGESVGIDSFEDLEDDACIEAEHEEEGDGEGGGEGSGLVCTRETTCCGVDGDDASNDDGGFCLDPDNPDGCADQDQACLDACEQSCLGAEFICDDGLDGDGDGVTDGADVDCAG